MDVPDGRSEPSRARGKNHAHHRRQVEARDHLRAGDEGTASLRRAAAADSQGHSADADPAAPRPGAPRLDRADVLQGDSSPRRVRGDAAGTKPRSDLQEHLRLGDAELSFDRPGAGAIRQEKLAAIPWISGSAGAATM